MAFDDDAVVSLVVDASGLEPTLAENYAKRLTAALKGVAVAAAGSAESVTIAGARIVTSLGNQTRFLDSMEKKLSPFTLEIRKAIQELNRLMGVRDEAAAGGAGADKVLERTTELIRRQAVKIAELQSAQNLQQKEQARAQSPAYAEMLQKTAAATDASARAQKRYAELFGLVAGAAKEAIAQHMALLREYEVTLSLTGKGAATVAAVSEVLANSANKMTSEWQTSHGALVSWTEEFNPAIISSRSLTQEMIKLSLAHQAGVMTMEQYKRKQIELVNASTALERQQRRVQGSGPQLMGFEGPTVSYNLTPYNEMLQKTAAASDSAARASRELAKAFGILAAIEQTVAAGFAEHLSILKEYEVTLVHTGRSMASVAGVGELLKNSASRVGGDFLTAARALADMTEEFNPNIVASSALTQAMIKLNSAFKANVIGVEERNRQSAEIIANFNKEGAAGMKAAAELEAAAQRNIKASQLQLQIDKDVAAAAQRRFAGIQDKVLAGSVTDQDFKSRTQMLPTASVEDNMRLFGVGTAAELEKVLKFEAAVEQQTRELAREAQALQKEFDADAAALRNYNEALSRLHTMAAANGMDAETLKTKMAALRAEYDKNTVAGKAAAEAAKQQAQANRAAATEDQRTTNLSQQLRGVLDPVKAKTEAYNQALAQMNNLLELGKITATEHAAALKLPHEQLIQLATNQNFVAGSSRQLQYALTNLSFQVNDVVSGLMMGQTPFRIFAQQAGQIYQLIGQGGGPSAIVKGSIEGLRNWGIAAGTFIVSGAGAATIGLTALAAAFALVLTRAISIQGEIRRLNVAMRVLGTDSLASGKDIEEMLPEVVAAGVSRREAREGLEAFTQTPGLNPVAAARFNVLAGNISGALGGSHADRLKELATAFSGTADQAIEYAQKLNVLSGAEATNLLRMAEQGKTAEALLIIFGKLEQRTKGALLDSMSSGAKAIHALSTAWNEMLDALAKSAAFNFVIEQLTKIAELITAITKGKGQTAETFNNVLAGAGAGAAVGAVAGATGGFGVGALPLAIAGAVAGGVIAFFQPTPGGPSIPVYGPPGAAPAGPAFPPAPAIANRPLPGTLDLNLRPERRESSGTLSILRDREAETVARTSPVITASSVAGASEGSIQSGDVVPGLAPPKTFGIQDPSVIEKAIAAAKAYIKTQEDSVLVARQIGAASDLVAARLEVERLVREKVIPEIEKEKVLRIALAAVMDKTAASLDNQNKIQDVAIAGINANTEALRNSQVEGARQQAVTQATNEVYSKYGDAIDKVNKNAIIEARTRRIAGQAAAESAQSAQDRVRTLDQEVAGQQRLVAAYGLSTAAGKQMEAVNQALAETQKMVNDAEATGDKNAKARAERIQQETIERQKSLALRKAELAAEQTRNTAVDEIQVLRLQESMIGRTQEQIQAQVALLQQKQKLQNDGLKPEDPAYQNALNMVTALENQKLKLAQAQKEWQKLEDTVRSVADTIMNSMSSAINDVFEGKKVTDWGARIKSMFSQLMTQMTMNMFVKPMFGSVLGALGFDNLAQQYGTLGGNNSSGFDDAKLRLIAEAVNTTKNVQTMNITASSVNVAGEVKANINAPGVTTTSPGAASAAMTAPSSTLMGGAVNGTPNFGVQPGEILRGNNIVIADALKTVSSGLPAGYKIVITEGSASGGHVPGSQHYQNNAIDYKILTDTGAAIPNRGADTTGLYQSTYNAVKDYFQSNYPDLAGNLRYGGTFGVKGGPIGPGNPADLMHIDLQGAAQISAERLAEAKARLQGLGEAAQQASAPIAQVTEDERKLKAARDAAANENAAAIAAGAGSGSSTAPAAVNADAAAGELSANGLNAVKQDFDALNIKASELNFALDPVDDALASAGAAATDFGADFGGISQVIESGSSGFDRVKLKMEEMRVAAGDLETGIGAVADKSVDATAKMQVAGNNADAAGASAEAGAVRFDSAGRAISASAINTAATVASAQGSNFSVGGTIGSIGSALNTKSLGSGNFTQTLSTLGNSVSSLERLLGGGNSGSSGLLKELGLGGGSGWFSGPYGVGAQMGFGYTDPALANMIGIESNYVFQGSSGLFGGTTLGSALGGIGAGFTAGSLLNGLIGGNKMGGTVGSGLGSIAGFALGSAIGMPFLGALLGGAGGGLLGGLFGAKKPRNQSAGGDIDFSTGKITASFTGGNQQIDADTKQALTQISRFTQGLLEVSGGTLSGQVLLQNGVNTGFTADSTLPGFVGRFNLGKDSAQVVETVSLALSRSLEGISETMRTVINQITDPSMLEEGIRFAKVYDDIKKAADSAFTGIDSDLQQIGPFATALENINEIFKEITANAEKFGLSLEPVNLALAEAHRRLTLDFDRAVQDAILGITDPTALALQQVQRENEARLKEAEAVGGNILEVNRLNAMLLEQVWEQQKSTIVASFESLTALQKSLLQGELSGKSTVERMALAQEDFRTALAAVNAGDLTQLETLVQAGTDVATLSQEAYGNAPQTQTAVEELLRGIDQALLQQNVRPPVVNVTVTPVVNTTSTVTTSETTTTVATTVDTSAVTTTVTPTETAAVNDNVIPVSEPQYIDSGAGDGGYARGTQFTPPGTILVGEEGPELITQSGGLQVWSNPETEKILAGTQRAFADGTELNSSSSASAVLDQGVTTAWLETKFNEQAALLSEANSIAQQNGDSITNINNGVELDHIRYLTQQVDLLRASNDNMLLSTTVQEQTLAEILLVNRAQEAKLGIINESLLALPGLMPVAPAPVTATPVVTAAPVVTAPASATTPTERSWLDYSPASSFLNKQSSLSRIGGKYLEPQELTPEYIRSIQPNVVGVFASGTMATPPGMILVGERGPEIITQPGGLQVLPNDVTRTLIENGRAFETGTEGFVMASESAAYRTNSARGDSKEMLKAMATMAQLLQGGNEISQKSTQAILQRLDAQLQKMESVSLPEPTKRKAA